MGNLVSLMAQVPRGGEVIGGEGNHSFAHEAANFAVVVGASMKLLPWDQNGRMDLDQIRRAFRHAEDVHEPITSLVTLENTHADSMAQPLPVDYVTAVADIAHERGVPLHVDGARIFNASVALGTPVSTLLGPADSATFCLSKGLACPVGSVVVGSRDFIWKARRARKLLGGGLRQVGVLAAPGLIALRDRPGGMIERLAEDHVNARRLATGIAGLPGVVNLDPTRANTNFVFFELAEPELRMPFLDALAAEGVLMIDYPGGDRVRAVTHYGIEEPDIDAAIEATRRALATVGSRPHGRPRPQAPVPEPPGPSRTTGREHAPSALTPADERLDRLIRAHVSRTRCAASALATYLGYPGYDDVLADGSRDAVLDGAAATRSYLTQLSSSIAPACRPISWSSATWRSTRLVWSSSTPNSTASGNDASRLPTRSATRSSCSSLVVRGRWPSDSCPSVRVSRRRRAISSSRSRRLGQRPVALERDGARSPRIASFAL